MTEDINNKNSIISSYKIRQIIGKVRQIFKYDLMLKKLIVVHPKILFNEDEKGNIVLQYILFSNYYDKLEITSTKICFKEDGKETKVVIEYNDWDDILAL